MAESMLDGAKGDDEEAADAETGASPVSAQAFAAALAEEQARRDPDVARAAAQFLRDQSAMLRTQTSIIEEQRPLQMVHLHHREREGELRRFGLRVRNAMQVLTALVFFAIGAGLCLLMYDATASRSVVVEPFSAPPALAAQGVSDKVVASAVLDALQLLSDASRTTTAGLTAQNAWTSDVQIDLPETGISVGEISRLLHQRFGHNLHVNGDLILAQNGGMALTVRGDAIPPKTFTGAATALGKLAADAAEYVCGRSQPFQFASYLVNNGRDVDALAFLPGAFARAGSDHDRARLANVWGNAFIDLGRHAEATEKHQLAISLDQDYWNPRSNLLTDLCVAGAEEESWREGQAFFKLVGKKPERDRPDLRLSVMAAQVVWDLPLLRDALLADAAFNGGAGSYTAIDGPGIADIYAMLHDLPRAARYMASSDPDDPLTKAEAGLLPGYSALDRGDPAGAVASLEVFWAAWQNNSVVRTTYFDNGCLLGFAYGMVGRLTDAEAVFKRVGPWSRCYAFKGDVLEHAGNLAGAEQVWAEGLRVSPDLPFVYLHRGLSEERRHDLKAAEQDLAAAAARTPHFADPTKAWGDLLALEGRWTEALSRYDEALKHAPDWAELHQSRDYAANKI